MTAINFSEFFPFYQKRLPRLRQLNRLANSKIVSVKEADVNAKTKYLLTPLEVAITADRPDMEKLLRAHDGCEIYEK